MGVDGGRFICEVCGDYLVSRTALISRLGYPNGDALDPLTLRQRAGLSHYLRQRFDAARQPIMLTDPFLQEFLATDQLPTPAEQASAAIRIIGDYVQESGSALPITPRHFFAAIGAMTPERADRILLELEARGDLVAYSHGGMAPGGWTELDLTLAGWDKFEQERRGKNAGTYGFIAMKFGDPILDQFVLDVVKPATVRAGYRLIDLRDVRRAGVIDNLLRVQLRDASFVVADLTHGNNGAYWEAGFAEGLGKPVIYLCEKARFDDTKTHFDTNHCTTVMWDAADPSSFEEDFVATLQNSLRDLP